MSQQSAYPLRLDPELKKKIQALARINNRSFRGEVENILKNYIQNYEKINGAIQIKETQEKDGY